MSSHFKFLVLIISGILLIGAQVSDTLYGKIIGVHDGDSITLLLDGNVQLKVRLEGIDCPESKQAFGTKAKQFTSDLAFGHQITLHQTGKDRYSRTLGFIILPDSRNLNEELLKAGLAWHFKKYNKDPHLADLESMARNERRGLWKEPNPIPPWEFRK